MQNEINASVVKVSPPVAVAFSEWLVGNIDKVVLAATLVYTVLMIAHLTYKFVCDVKDRREKNKKESES
jgi:hypothetical protein